MKAVDRARLKGYLQMCNQGKILVGCAMYSEILKPPSILSLTSQEEQFDIILGLKQILKSVSTLQSLAKQDPKNWPTVKLVVGRVSEESGQKFSKTSPITCSPNVPAKLSLTSSSWMAR